MDWADEEALRLCKVEWPERDIADALRERDAAAEKRGRIAGLREAAKRADRHPCVGLVTERSIGEVLRETADKLEQSP